MARVTDKLTEKLKAYVDARATEISEKPPVNCSYDRGYDDGQFAAFHEILFYLKLRNDIRSNGKLIIDNETGSAE